ncbi:hypothetical protein [Aphanothece sacrum]|uniref:Uncharacterized protein n=1 Tax=Aphanothece sacrum FPU1 TaxID=1920663 RepID=A0A401IKA2_APHSA|nr:hypothetical protein [Aphanothece sacrum]GBF81723.1 hypothetical protein AsFPU1_3143 [Aphanothece sacrum FPU1]GBF85081.1 hypothetical protein AsFPU3_2138 [Aphanothece sacrum FPU3]
MANNNLNKPFLIAQDFALFLTASVDVKGMPKAYPTVAEQREQDYYNSLTYYIQNHPKVRKIIFVENSGWPLDKLKQVAQNNPHNKEIEFISLNCNDFPRKFGKGYGECLLIEKGLEQSNLIKTVTHFAKITGRIYLQNITQVLESISEPYDCLCDYKDQGWRLKKLLGEESAGPNCDTRFLVFSQKFYHEIIKPLHQKHKEGTVSYCFYIESQFYQAINNLADKYKVITRFLIEPDFKGIAGHFGGKNYSSPQERAKFFIRSIGRKITPWIHF